MRIISLVSVLVLSSNFAWATDSFIEEHNYEYNFQSVNIGTNPNSGSVVTVSDSLNLNDVNVSVSGWADSERLAVGDSGDYDRVIGANLQYVDSYGWAVRNSWEDTGSHQTIDNYSVDGYKDYDFILLSFSEEVQLDSLNFGWANFRDGSQEVSVSALSDNGFNELTSTNSTWSNIISDAVSSSFSIQRLSENRGISTLDFTSSAKYWLVGAYNTIFGTVANGSKYNDAFKIAGLGFSNTTEKETTTEVSEPGALALMSLGLGLVLYRRKRRV
ncbi:PEP-CTERM sorting domain-containing protein [Alteromonas mediterranea]|uniref:exosortase-dependent surface protein XDP1 n=1 Tax=Alteromonas mediterranea TaxID=314275 RepID=UPI0011319E17|nr:exosortase-dependent surface protein XDP1 [Alteromonas mediterranea]QDG39028.1 PEP-CTERM sorting domain-containing protein [Alteromonas mediterranea]